MYLERGYGRPHPEAANLTTPTHVCTSQAVHVSCSEANRCVAACGMECYSAGRREGRGEDAAEREPTLLRMCEAQATPFL